MGSMSRRGRFFSVVGEGAAGPPPGPYDPDPDRAEPPWFLPAGPVEDAAPKAADTRAWSRAEAGAAVALARAAAALGALDDRLARGPEGWALRLALAEAGEVAWAAGERVAAERLWLWRAGHLAGALPDQPALARAGWALRQLLAPAGAPWPGAERPEELANLARFLAPLAACHPLTRAAAAATAWARAGQGAAEAELEAPVLAARIAAGADGRADRGAARGAAGGGAPFCPLALGGGAALRARGPDRFAAFCAGAETACRAALMLLDRVEAWEARARGLTGDLTGRTPARMIVAFRAEPALTAPALARITGAGRATVQRNLDLFAGRGLLREITGQARWRVWTAAL